MSTRQDILTKLDTALSKIRKSQGYNTNAGLNSAEWESKIKKETEPALVWRDLSSMVEHEDVPFSKQRHFLTVEVELVCTGSTSPETAREILEDIVSCLYTNRKWGGLARWTSVDEHALNVNHDEKKITGGQVVCVIEYDTDLGNI